MQALESSLLALGPWGVVAVAAMYLLRAMSKAVDKRAATVRGLLEERTKENRDLKAENERLEEALDIERAKRRHAEDERDRLQRELSLAARSSYQAGSAMVQRNAWRPAAGWGDLPGVGAQSDDERAERGGC